MVQRRLDCFLRQNWTIRYISVKNVDNKKYIEQNISAFSLNRPDAKVHVDRPLQDRYSQAHVSWQSDIPAALLV